MSYATKNKVMIGLLLLLLIANIVTITFFWLGKPVGKQMPRAWQQPSAYLIKELGFDEKQQQAYLSMVKEHQTGAAELRKQLGNAKDNFFKLLQQPSLEDSIKAKALTDITILTGQLDSLTFEHFKKVRALCNIDQQKKFDDIIADVMRMVGAPGPQQNMQRPGPPDGPPGRRQGPPPPPGEGPPPPPPGQ